MKDLPLTFVSVVSTIPGQRVTTMKPSSLRWRAHLVAATCAAAFVMLYTTRSATPPSRMHLRSAPELPITMIFLVDPARRRGRKAETPCTTPSVLTLNCR